MMTYGDKGKHILRGLNYTYERESVKEHGRWKDRWRCMNSPRLWDGWLTVDQLAQLSGVNISKQAVRQRLLNGTHSIFDDRMNKEKGLEVKKAICKFRGSQKVMRMLHKWPAPKYRPQPSFGVW